MNRRLDERGYFSNRLRSADPGSAMRTVILRIDEHRGIGLRGTVEIPGGDHHKFTTDEELLETLYEWTGRSDESGKGSGSTSSSAIRDT